MDSITQEQIHAAVKLNSPKLVKEVYDIALRQTQFENSRQTILEGKANALLSTVGIVLTLAFTIGAPTLLAKDSVFKSLDTTFRWIFVLSTICAIGCAIGAAANGIAALRVTGAYRTVTESNIFNDAVLASADEESDDKAVSIYQRFMIPQLWEIAQHDARVHARKAALVHRGQWCFMGFIVATAIMSMMAINRFIYSARDQTASQAASAAPICCVPCPSSLAPTTSPRIER